MTTEKRRINSVLHVLHFALPIILTVLWLVFIYGNSLKSGIESSEQSGRIYKLISEISSFLGYDGTISEHFIRKCAHFIEFAVLDLLLCLDLWALGILSLKKRLYISLSFALTSIPLCAVFASVDEILQTFSVDRGPSVKDVFIDLSGSVAAVIFFILFFTLSKFILNRKQNSSLK